MKNIFLISPPGPLSKSLERYFRYSLTIPVHHYPFKENPGLEDKAVWVARTFTQLSQWLQKHLADGDLTTGIGVIELYDESISSLNELNPIHTNQTWAAVAAMLILAFPEIAWTFITPYSFKKGQDTTEEVDILNKYFKLDLSGEIPRIDFSRSLSLIDGNCSLIFDPFGLGNIIRRNMINTDGTQRPDYIPIRWEKVIVVDEEEDYAWFVSYIAHRFGYRVVHVNSYYVLQKLQEISPGGFSISFEDVFLNFPDRPDIRLSDLRARHDQFPVLKTNIQAHLIVTSGHEISADNSKYIDELKAEKIYKPFSGMFDMWKKVYSKNPGLKWAKTYAESLSKMKQPPAVDPAGNPHGHSAPGRLLIIASSLIKRAIKYSESANTVPQALFGGALALYAQEFLGGRTPTVSLQALSLKHKLEVMAESMFYGVGYSIEQNDRFADLKEDICLISRWFEDKDSAELNSQIKIINSMALVFQEQGLFDEENESSMKIRSLYQQLTSKRNRIGWLESVVLRYINWCLRSIWNFLLALCLWVAAWTVIFACINIFCDKIDLSMPSLHQNIAHGLYDAAIAFFSLQPAHDVSSSPELLDMIASIPLIIISYFHLGIFISYIYSLITRKS